MTNPNVIFYRGTDADHEGITYDGVLSFNSMRGTIPGEMEQQPISIPE